MRIAFVALAAIGLLSIGGGAASQGSTVKAGDCDGLKSFAVKDGQVTAAARVRPATDATQAYCRVQITVKPEPGSNIRIEVWLPEAGRWNGKFLGTGNGGAAGSISAAALAGGVARGYAVANTDMGSSNGKGGLNFGFAIGRPELQKDFSYRSTDAMTIEGKRVTAAYYGKASTYAYFQGCSTGGYQAWEQIQRLPGEYNGVVAGAAANDRPNLHMTRIWDELKNVGAADQTIPKPMLAVITKAATAQCDALDGVKDGIIADPRRCHFNPTSLICKKGQTADCLTSKQAATMNAVYNGAHNPRTKALVYPGFERGAETGIDLHWEGKPADGGKVIVTDNLINWSAAYQKAHPDGVGFDFDRDVAITDADLNAMMNYTDPKLTAFQKAGGKVLIYHGWADSLVPSRGTPNYYERIAAANGGFAKTQGFARLFMAPGMAHCRGGVGADQFDMLSALESWVEKGQAPASVLATRTAKGDLPALTRPLCPYPAEAVYKGAGANTDAANFSCKVVKAAEKG